MNIPNTFTLPGNRFYAMPIAGQDAMYEIRHWATEERIGIFNVEENSLKFEAAYSTHSLNALADLCMLGRHVAALPDTVHIH